jgi:hypothetical protein
VSLMPWLPAWLTTAGCLDDRLGCPRWIGRRGCGAIGVIASELTEEFTDLGFQDCDPGQGGVEFTTQPHAFRALRAWGQSVRSHDDAAYSVAKQEQGLRLSRPAWQTRCRRRTGRLPEDFHGWGSNVWDRSDFAVPESVGASLPCRGGGFGLIAVTAGPPIEA